MGGVVDIEVGLWSRAKRRWLFDRCFETSMKGRRTIP